MSLPPSIAMRGIVKRYGAVTAVDGVDFECAPGEFHAIAGENGAGKSTLMRVLYGLVRPDEGSMALDGVPFAPDGPRDALARGLGMVHQHFMLLGPCTVLENAMLGAEPARFGWLDRAAARRALEDVAERFDLQLDPDARVEDLSVGERQRVEILKVLLRGARRLVLDEPTAVLAPGAARALFRTLERLAADGATILFVTHRLREVLDHARRVTVLRRGRKVATRLAAETDERELARLLVGRDLAPRDPTARAPAGEVVLSLRRVADASRESRLADVSLDVRAAEIVGIAGVEGNGQRELVEIVAGLRGFRGVVTLHGRSLAGKGPGAARRLGVAHVPEDRLAAGGIAGFTVAENLILGREGERRFRRGIALDAGAIRRFAAERIAAFDIRPPDPDAALGALSGGNQQKLVFARAEEGRPALVVAAQPTRGVDVGAAEAIHGALLDVRDRGGAVLLVSADLGEILRLSDRIVVLFAGRIAGTFVRDEADEEEIGLLMAGVSRTKDQRA
ncbi:MAG: ABC transporter ATP-binding protein [bacterium]